MTVVVAVVSPFKNKVVTATFIKGENIASIGASTKSCTIEAGNSSCKITLPAITPNEGYILDGWYNGNNKIGNPNDEYVISDNITLTSKVNEDSASLTVSTRATTNTITAIANANATSTITKYEFQMMVAALGKKVILIYTYLNI